MYISLSSSGHAESPLLTQVREDWLILRGHNRLRFGSHETSPSIWIAYKLIVRRWQEGAKHTVEVAGGGGVVKTTGKQNALAPLNQVIIIRGQLHSYQSLLWPFMIQPSVIDNSYAEISTNERRRKLWTWWWKEESPAIALRRLVFLGILTNIVVAPQCFAKPKSGNCSFSFF